MENKTAAVNAVTRSSSFENIMTGLSPEIKDIARALRDLIANVLPGATEVAWEKQRIVGYGVGPKKMPDQSYYFFEH